MAHQGQTLRNEVTGETFTFLQTARNTDGELFVFDNRIRAGGHVAAAHVHAKQEEQFEVIKGRLAYRVGRRHGMLEQGERVVVPPGTPHEWLNPTNEEIVVRTEFRPALDKEGFFELFCGLAEDGKVDAKGVPSFWQLVIASPHYQIFLARPPVPVQRALFAILRPIAWLLGYRAQYDRYVGRSTDLAQLGHSR